MDVKLFTWPQSLKVAKELGFEFIHINAGYPGDQNFIGDEKVVQSYTSAIAEMGVLIKGLAFNYIEHFGIEADSDGNIHRNFETILKRVLEAAQALQIPMVYFPSFNKSEIKDQQALSRTCILLKRACFFAEPLGLSIVTENSLSPSLNQQLFQEVGSSRLKLLLDTQNPSIWGHSVTEIIGTMYPNMINQVHVKDGRNKSMGNSRLGMGDSSLEKTLNLLLEKGYAGLFVLENDYTSDTLSRVEYDRQFLSLACATR